MIYDTGYTTSHRLLAAVDPEGYRTSYGYDANGLVKTVKRPSGHVTTYTFEDWTNTVIEDAGGGLTTISYNVARNPTVVEDPNGNRTSYTWDNNRLTCFQDGNGVCTTFTYAELPNRRGATGGLPTSAIAGPASKHAQHQPIGYNLLHSGDSQSTRRTATMPGHRKRVKHYHEPGDCHELTFSCYRRLPLLTNDVWRKMLAVSIDRAIERHKFRLVAFVFMPEHVHLLVYPAKPEPDLSALLKAIKRPYSYRIKQLLKEHNSPLLERLTIRERPGKTTFRYWQEGPGYDRNLDNEKSVRAAIDYIHLNPIRRGLCENVLDWKWSSAGWYADREDAIDLDLPTIHGLPAEFFGDADPD